MNKPGGLLPPGRGKRLRTFQPGSGALEGAMTTIRVAEVADGAACADIYRPIVEATWISFETEAPSSDDMGQRIAATLPRLPWLVACDGGATLGYAYASPHRERAAYRWSVDVTIYLAGAARRRGIGTRLYTVLFDLLRRQGYRSAFAGVALPNDASIGLHQALGFHPIGTYEEVGWKLGGWRAVHWLRLPLSQASGSPDDPLPFGALRRDTAFPGWLG
jgi:phosphinothricin acetyltransferase